MTGTPIENRLEELWSLFEFLNPGMLGASSAFSALARLDDVGRMRPRTRRAGARAAPGDLAANEGPGGARSAGAHRADAVGRARGGAAKVL